MDLQPISVDIEAHSPVTWRSELADRSHTEPLTVRVDRDGGASWSRDAPTFGCQHSELEQQLLLESNGHPQASSCMHPVEEASLVFIPSLGTRSQHATHARSLDSDSAATT